MGESGQYQCSSVANTISAAIDSRFAPAAFAYWQLGGEGDLGDTRREHSLPTALLAVYAVGSHVAARASD